MIDTTAAVKVEVMPQEVYQEFQAIVGPEYVTTDPVICQAYTGRGYARGFH